MGKSKLPAVGAFVVAGFLLFGVALFLIGDRRRLFDDSFEIQTEFATLAGVSNGATVRVAGIDAGEVVEIVLPRSPAEKFRVHLRVIEDLHPLIRTDSVASIQTDGLVGNQIIQIEAGSESAPPVSPGGLIPGREPFQLQELMEQAGNTIALLDRTIESLSDDLEKTVTTVTETMEDADRILVDVGENITEMSRSAVDITSDVRVMVDDVRQGKGTLGRLVRDETLYDETTAIAEQIRRISEDAADTAENVKVVSEQAKSMFTQLRDNGGNPAPGLLQDVRSTIASAREAMGDMAESMESMKRGFLFRGMFLERGFFDLDSLTVDEYLEGGIRDKHHRNLRIWISAAELFGQDDRGREILSDAGRSKLDASLREILRYPSNAPLIVEGYSAAGTLDARFRTAQSRAAMVKDYILDAYRRDANYTGHIAMDRYEPLDVDADGGDGVVLALYYDDTAARAPRNRIH